MEVDVVELHVHAWASHSNAGTDKRAPEHLTLPRTAAADEARTDGETSAAGDENRRAPAILVVANTVRADISRSRAVDEVEEGEAQRAAVLHQKQARAARAVQRHTTSVDRRASRDRHCAVRSDHGGCL